MQAQEPDISVKTTVERKIETSTKEKAIYFSCAGIQACVIVPPVQNRITKAFATVFLQILAKYV